MHHLRRDLPARLAGRRDRPDHVTGVNPLGQGGAPVGRPLDRLAPGEGGLIVHIDAEPGIKRRLMELGLVPGTHVEMVRSAPLGDPIEVTVRGLHLSLRRSEARHIHVAAR